MTTETTVTHPAEDWSDGPIGNDHGYADVDEFEESMEHSRYTLAGIEERANVMEPHNAENRNEYRASLATDAIDFLMSEIAKNQAIQKANRSDSPAWVAASANLAPLFSEMAKFQAAGFDTDVRGEAK